MESQNSRKQERTDQNINRHEVRHTNNRACAVFITKPVKPAHTCLHDFETLLFIRNLFGAVLGFSKTELLSISNIVVAFM